MSINKYAPLLLTAAMALSPELVEAKVTANTHHTKPLEYRIPGVKANGCDVDIDYPSITIKWDDSKGPSYSSKNPELPFVLQNTNVTDLTDPGTDADIMHTYATEISQGYTDFVPVEVADYSLKTRSALRYVQAVVAIDASGSMNDNNGLTSQIEDQLKSHDNGANVRVQTLKYDHTGVYDNGNLIYNETADRREEDHIGALWQGMQYLEKLQGAKYLFLVTDEGLKSGFEYVQAIKNEAKRMGVHIFFVYDDKDLKNNVWAASNEDFSELIGVAKSTESRALGNSVIKMENGQIPKIFKPRIYISNYSEISFEDALPYIPGDRVFYTVSGAGAVCVATIGQDTINEAIIAGRLPLLDEEVFDVEESRFDSFLDWVKENQVVCASFALFLILLASKALRRKRNYPESPTEY